MFFILILPVALSISGYAQDQPPPPVQLDPRPIERPLVFYFFKTNDATRLLDSVENIIKKAKYEIVNRDENNQQLEAKRKINQTRDFEKILIWLERDFENPELKLKLYFFYGYYQKVFGYSDPQRILLSLEQELENTGHITTSIKKIKTN